MSRSAQDILRELGRVTSALLHEKGSIAPVDVFLRLGSLTQADYERWRRGQIPVLERVIQSNLTRITFILQALRRQSQRDHCPSSQGRNHQHPLSRCWNLPLARPLPSRSPLVRHSTSCCNAVSRCATSLVGTVRPSSRIKPPDG